MTDVINENKNDNDNINRLNNVKNSMLSNAVIRVTECVKINIGIGPFVEKFRFVKQCSLSTKPCGTNKNCNKNLGTLNQWNRLHVLDLFYNLHKIFPGLFYIKNISFT